MKRQEIKSSPFYLTNDKMLQDKILIIINTLNRRRIKKRWYGPLVKKENIISSIKRFSLIHKIDIPEAILYIKKIVENEPERIDLSNIDYKKEEK